MANTRIIAAVLAAAALAVPTIAVHEGYVPKGYLDPVGIPTAGWGHTGGIVVGKIYTEDQLEAWLASDAVTHGLEISRCLPAELPVETRAAFTSFAFNIGSARFCSSGLARKARAGDIRGACDELSKWIYAKGRVLPGLVTRRRQERALCLSGLS